MPSSFEAGGSVDPDGQAAMLSDIPTVGSSGSVARVAAIAVPLGRLAERGVSLRALLLALLEGWMGAPRRRNY